MIVYNIKILRSEEMRLCSNVLCDNKFKIKKKFKKKYCGKCLDQSSYSKLTIDKIRNSLDNLNLLALKTVYTGNLGYGLKLNLGTIQLGYAASKFDFDDVKDKLRKLICQVEHDIEIINKIKT